MKRKHFSIAIKSIDSKKTHNQTNQDNLDQCVSSPPLCSKQLAYERYFPQELSFVVLSAW